MFFIHCDFLKRDIVTSKLIKKYIEVNGNTSAYITSRINTRIFFNRFYTHVWVLNTDMYFYLLKNEYEKVKKSNIIIYEQEGFVGEEARAVMFNNGKGLEFVDTIIVWGKESYNHLVKKLNIPESKVKIGGLYRLLNSKVKNTTTIDTIGIVTRHTTLRREITSNVIEKIYDENFSSENELFSFTLAMQRSILELSLLFKKIRNLKDKYNYSFRLHPIENIDVYTFLDKYDNYSIDTMTDFGSWLNTVDAVLSPPSSSIFECIAARKPVFYVNDDNSIVPNSNDLSYKVFYSYAQDISKISEYNQSKVSLNNEVQSFIDDYYNSFKCNFTYFDSPKNEKIINENYLISFDMLIHIYMLRNKNMLDYTSNYSRFFSNLNISNISEELNFKAGIVSI